MLIIDYSLFLQLPLLFLDNISSLNITCILHI